VHFFDTHFHYSGEATPAEYLNRCLTDAWGAGVFPSTLELNAVGGDYLESLRAREFAHAVPDCVFSCGVHPGSVERFSGDIRAFDIFRDDPLLAAVGELGLDYFYAAETAEQQRKVFAQFLELALQWNKPAIVHLRDQGDDSAFVDGMALLKDFAAAGGRFEVHCFTGAWKWGEKILELGGYIGVTGMITFRKAENLREIAKMVPADRLLLETDSPYLAPIPYRGKENHPGFLGLVAAQAAEVRGVSIAELCEQTSCNGRRFFGVENRTLGELKKEDFL
jgi:TatD DNase family protein